jgi:hypothetical protein
VDLSPKFNLGADIANDDTIVALLADGDVALQFYASLCNMRWESISRLPDDDKMIERLKGVNSEIWSCSWRYAGGIIADIRNEHYNTGESYISFYCSFTTAFAEGTVTELVRKHFERIGWKPCPWDDDNFI